MLRNLSASDPAAHKRTSDNAAWAMTSDFCAQPEAWVVERWAPRRASDGSAWAVIHAGATPNRIPVSRQTTNEKASTGNEGVALMDTWLSRNARFRMRRVQAKANATPTMPPSKASTVLSVSTCDI